MEYISENLFQNIILYMKILNLYLYNIYIYIHEISKYESSGNEIILSDINLNPSIPIGLAV